MTEPELIPAISFNRIVNSRTLWPSTLELRQTKQVEIRFNGKSYGDIEFLKGSIVEVQALKMPSEVVGILNGNYLSLTLSETNFEDWFRMQYSEYYDLKIDDLRVPEAVTVLLSDIDTAEGYKVFWRDLQYWCYVNYDTAQLTIEEDTLTFEWLPKENVPVDFRAEAREIARKYLLKKAEFGGEENYAACQIIHPDSGEQLGASFTFIPRF